MDLVANVRLCKKSIEYLGETSTLQQALVRNWYSQVDTTKLPLLLSASFLMELGKLIVAMRVLKSGQKEEFVQALEQSDNISGIEKQFFGIDSYGVGAVMFEHWNFESELIDVLNEINSPAFGSLAAILNVVCMAVNVKESLSENSVERAKTAIKQFGLDEVSFDKAVKELLKNKG